MLTELLGKGGQVCQPAREGQLRCPLIVRPTSEDVITGQMFQILRAINPRWWLPDLLNAGLGAARFRRQVYRRLKIELWKNRSPYPRELLPWNEGSTQVDVTLTWENPPTTVFLEMKYLSAVSDRTSGDDGTHGFPSDQIIRNARVGLLECGWFDRRQFFEAPPRDFVLLLVGASDPHPLVARYRDEVQLKQAIPHSGRLRGLPRAPFLGELSYGQIIHILRHNRRWLERSERVLADDLADYLQFKGRQPGSDSNRVQPQLWADGEVQQIERGKRK